MEDSINFSDNVETSMGTSKQPQENVGREYPKFDSLPPELKVERLRSELQNYKSALNYLSSMVEELRRIVNCHYHLNDIVLIPAASSLYNPYIGQYGEPKRDDPLE